MRRGLLILGAIQLLTLAGWYTIANSARPGTDAAPAETIPSPPAELLFRGTGSCAAGACHGGAKTSAQPWQSAYSVWATEDKHSQAYRLLFDLPAKTIVARLDKLPDPKLAKPFEDRRCLGCHAAADDLTPISRSRFVDGVSCEVCHGPAQHWIGAHTLSTWARRPDAEKYSAATGMINTKNLAARAKVCVDCHVGAPGTTHDGVSRDMNHDMIAAGHPRLNFELAAYLAIMPPHWRRATDEGKAWQVGQAVTTQAALELLVGRASAAATSEEAIWPEFSEYDCFACHHNLRGSSSQRQSTVGAASGESRRPGTYVWGSWYLAQTLTLAQRHGQAELSSRLAAVVKSMSHPFPAPDEVQQAAVAAEKDLSRLASTLDAKTDDASASQKTLLEIAAAPRLSNWDEAVQTYLACVALHNAQLTPPVGAGSKQDNATTQLLNTIRDRLRFKAVPAAAGGQGPSPPVSYNSPRDYDAGKLADDFKRLHSLLSESKK